MRRVVITGIGVVSPLGKDALTTWEKLVKGQSGIGHVQQCDVSDIACKIAGEVSLTSEPFSDSNGLNFDDYVEPKDQNRYGKYGLFGIVAAEEALKDANWAPKSDHDRQRTGVLIGSGIGGLEGIYQTSKTLIEKGPRRVSPFFIPSCLINMTSGNVAIKYGLLGPNHSVVTACSTGAHAIGDAARLIQMNDADVMVAGGTEATVCRIALAGFVAARAMSTAYNDAPTTASRPWDQGRDGFVMGEGAGIVVLEELEHAKKRGAKIYGEIIGYGLSGDAYHMTAPSEDGDGAYRAMKMAVERANVSVDDIGYVNAHGTSTPPGDVVEIKALRKLFGSAISKVSISSTKSSTGHLLGAAGALEAIFALLAMKHSLLPPTLNLHNPDPACEGIDLVPLKSKEKKVNYVLSNSFGFGGTNASLIFGRYS